MAKIQVIYDCRSEIEQIIKVVESHLNLKNEEDGVFDEVQKIIQTAFDEGRKFQKQISITSPVKDSIIFKSEI
jgi:hypothetical protein